MKTDVSQPKRIYFRDLGNAVVFSNLVRPVDAFVYLRGDSFKINAKSLLGILTLDPDCVYDLEIDGTDADIDKVNDLVQEFLV